MFLFINKPRGLFHTWNKIREKVLLNSIRVNIFKNFQVFTPIFRQSFRSKHSSEHLLLSYNYLVLTFLQPGRSLSIPLHDFSIFTSFLFSFSISRAVKYWSAYNNKLQRLLKWGELKRNYPTKKFVEFCAYNLKKRGDMMTKFLPNCSEICSKMPKWDYFKKGKTHFLQIAKPVVTLEAKLWVGLKRFSF